MFKKYIVFPLLILTGFFGPFFGHTKEERTKNISLELATEVRPTRDTMSDTTRPVRTRNHTELREHACARSFDFFQGGNASWYGPGFHGRKMANGQVFDMYGYTVAHSTLRFGTRVCITNPENGRWVLATVTDRGRFNEYGRIVDLSKQVARDLLITGVTPVNIYVET